MLRIFPEFFDSLAQTIEKRTPAMVTPEEVPEVPFSGEFTVAEVRRKTPDLAGWASRESLDGRKLPGTIVHPHIRIGMVERGLRFAVQTTLVPEWVERLWVVYYRSEERNVVGPNGDIRVSALVGYVYGARPRALREREKRARFVHEQAHVYCLLGGFSTLSLVGGLVGDLTNLLVHAPFVRSFRLREVLQAEDSFALGLSDPSRYKDRTNKAYEEGRLHLWTGEEFLCGVRFSVGAELEDAVEKALEAKASQEWGLTEEGLHSLFCEPEGGLWL